MFRELLVVPHAHVLLGDFRYQAELYDVFHLRWPSRIAHMLCTPTVIMATLVILDAWVPVQTPGGTPLGGVFGMVALGAYWVGLDAIVGLITLLPLLGLWLGAGGLSRLLGHDAVAVCWLIMPCAAAVQALSHLSEAMPPPWSGSAGFRPLDVVRIGWTSAEIPKLIGLGLTAVFLEWWAAYRIFGLQMHFCAMQAGLRPHLRASLEAKRPEILADLGRCAPRQSCA